VTTPAPDLTMYQPHPSPQSVGFWDNLEQGRITLQRCGDCGRWTHPPLEYCASCAGPLAFEPVSGLGTVYSYTILHRAPAPLYEVPYAVAVVELAEQSGLRMVGRVIDVDLAEIHIGMAVRAAIVDLPGGDAHVVAFRPETQP
jgi:uncharacterized OB-fold protein